MGLWNPPIWIQHSLRGHFNAAQSTLNALTLSVVSVDIGQAGVSQILLQFDTGTGESGAALERLPSKHPCLTAVPQKSARGQNPPSYRL